MLKMILSIIIMLVVCIIAFIGVAGAIGVMYFGDIIIAVLIIFLIIRHFRK